MVKGTVFCGRCVLAMALLAAFWYTCCGVGWILDNMTLYSTERCRCEIPFCMHHGRFWDFCAGSLSPLDVVLPAVNRVLLKSSSKAKMLHWEGS